MRKGWNGETIIQNAAEDSLSKYGIIEKNGRPHTILSKNSIPIGHYSGIPENLPVEPIEWKKIPLDFFKKSYKKDTEHNEIVYGKVQHKDSGRCVVQLGIKNIENLSLPQDKKDYWKGKLLRHKDKNKKDAVEKKEKGNNCHYLLSEWRWFNKPFELPKDRNEVEMWNNGDLYEIKFTIQKTAKVKEWL